MQTIKLDNKLNWFLGNVHHIHKSLEFSDAWWTNNEEYKLSYRGNIVSH